MSVVRRGTVGDIDAVVALGEAVVPVTYGPIDPAYAAFTLERWWSRAAVAESVERLPHWVVEVDGQLAGVANLGTLDDGTAVMWKLYVHPGHHGAGLGSALLAAVEREVASGPLELEYLGGNDRAASFYRRRGFAEARRSRIEKFPSLDWIWMRKDL